MQSTGSKSRSKLYLDHTDPATEPRGCPAPEGGKEQSAQLAASSPSIVGDGMGHSAQADESSVVKSQGADTVSRVELLKQALVSRDLRLFDMVVNTVNRQVINQTVGQLPSTYANPFLEQLVTKLESCAIGAVPKYLAWVKAVLTTHYSYLLTVTSYKKVFDRLRAVGQQTLEHEDPLIRIQALLDFAVFRADKKVNLNNMIEEMLSDSVEPLVVYVEGDEKLRTIPATTEILAKLKNQQTISHKRRGYAELGYVTSRDLAGQAASTSDGLGS